MRALVLAPPMESTGGIQRCASTLVRALQQVLDEQSVRLLAVETAPEEAERETQGSGRKGLGVAPKLCFARKALREAGRWKVELCLCVHVGLAPVGWLIRTVFRCPYWVVAHGIEVWGRLAYGKRRALREADRILAVSAFTRQRLIERHQVSPDRVLVFPNAVDEALLKVSPDPEGLARAGLNRSRVILTVGRLAASERYKGHAVVLRALPAVLARAPDVVYVVAGDGDDRPRLEHLARQLGVQDRVTFLGCVAGPMLAACYNACHVFALPAETVLDDQAPKGEGFGIAFIEAMAFGKPLVGPNYGAPTEIIRHGENGLLVNPESPDEVAAALLALLTQPELARRMGEQGRQLVEREYSFGAMVRRLERMLTPSN